MSQETAREIIAEVVEKRSRLGLFCCDMRDLLPLIPDHSVDLIITDPPYDNSAHWMYFFLYQEAGRLLKPGGHYLCITPQYLLCPFNSSLRSFIPEGWQDPNDLKLRWTIQMRQDEGPHPRLVNGDRNLEVLGKTISLYTALPRTNNDYRGLRDSFDSRPIDKRDKLHKWQQSKEWAEYCLQLAPPEPGAVILDPMIGAGTIPLFAYKQGHYVLGCDMDPEALKITRERLAEEGVTVEAERETRGSGEDAPGDLEQSASPEVCSESGDL